jgi:hypothetical protein
MADAAGMLLAAPAEPAVGAGSAAAGPCVQVISRAGPEPSPSLAGPEWRHPFLEDGGPAGHRSGADQREGQEATDS